MSSVVVLARLHTACMEYIQRSKHLIGKEEEKAMFLCFVNHHTMNKYGALGVATHILNLDTVCRSADSCRRRRLSTVSTGYESGWALEQVWTRWRK